MTDSIDPQIAAVLAEIIDPCTQQSLLALEAVSGVTLLEGRLSLALTLGYPGAQQREALVAQLGQALMSLSSVESVDIDAGWQVPEASAAQAKQNVSGVKHIIAVASGKGGVGKSTTSVNLALAMASLGARVGILDADIYGPSQPLMLGVADQRPEVIDQKIMQPVMAYGLQSNSMGYLLSEKTPAVWRGPMATGALQQLIFQTAWDELDYLFVDMPPGTGDIQLTLSQQVPVTGAVIVTTPQDIALLDAKKAIEMFAKVNIPVLGVVENMAIHICSNCGHQEPIFGAGGGDKLARDYQARLLGALPLDLSIRLSTDNGKPSVVADPEGDVAQLYQGIAQKVAAELWLQQTTSPNMPEIVVTND